MNLYDQFIEGNNLKPSTIKIFVIGLVVAVVILFGVGYYIGNLGNLSENGTISSKQRAELVKASTPTGGSSLSTNQEDALLKSGSATKAVSTISKEELDKLIKAGTPNKI